MLPKIIILFFIFYFLVLFQGDFLVHFKIFNAVPNLILLLIVFLNLLESSKDKTGLIAAFFGGFLLDIFSVSHNLFFGFYALVSLLIAAIIKLILKRYVSFPHKAAI